MFGNNLARVQDYSGDWGTTTLSGTEYAPPTGLSDRPHYTIEEATSSTWRAAAIKRLEQLVNLPPNWDSYGAKKITQRTAQISLQILDSVMRDSTPPPSIVPVPSGRIQLEWHARGIDLEVEVVSPILLHASFEDQLTAREWHMPLNVDLGVLNEAISVLSNRAQ